MATFKFSSALPGRENIAPLRNQQDPFRQGLVSQETRKPKRQRTEIEKMERKMKERNNKKRKVMPLEKQIEYLDMVGYDHEKLDSDNKLIISQDIELRQKEHQAAGHYRSTFPEAYKKLKVDELAANEDLHSSMTTKTYQNLKNNVLSAENIARMQFGLSSSAFPNSHITALRSISAETKVIFPSADSISKRKMNISKAGALFFECKIIGEVSDLAFRMDIMRVIDALIQSRLTMKVDLYKDDPLKLKFSMDGFKGLSYRSCFFSALIPMNHDQKGIQSVQNTLVYDVFLIFIPLCIHLHT